MGSLLSIMLFDHIIRSIKWSFYQINDVWSVFVNLNYTSSYNTAAVIAIP